MPDGNDPPPKLTEDLVANHLWTWRMKQGHTTASTRCHLYAAESDFLSLCNDYSHDHEIKLSRADYLNEIKQARPKPGKPHRFSSKHWKHTYLRRAHTGHPDFQPAKTPNYFHFVTPKGMLRRGDPFPHYAGLIEIDWVVESPYRPTPVLVFTVRRRAPLLHKTKVDPKVYRALARALAFRFFNARTARQ